MNKEQELKDKASEFINYIQSLGASREISLAITNAQQATMWAATHLANIGLIK